MVVSLNAKPPYAGNNAYTHREPGPLGLVDLNSEAAYLPLGIGHDEPLLAVTEYFGGWGLSCRFLPRLDPATSVCRARFAGRRGRQHGCARTAGLCGMIRPG